MAKCVDCGKWAGVGQTKHDWDCVGEIAAASATAAAPLGDQDIMIQKLTPIIQKAAVRAGIAAGITVAVIGVALGVVAAMIRS